MFIANTDHEENLLDYWEELLTPKQFALLKKSKGYQFYEIVFQQIEEEDFRCLYSEKFSAPNSPVNCLVSAMILCQLRDWSHEELENQIAFNIEIKLALGLKDIASIPFSMRTFYNFMIRLSSYEEREKINLIEQVFLKLTKKQTNSLGIKTTIQRGDSVLLESGIKSYSRLSLLVEVLSRVYSILKQEDQKKYQLLFQNYHLGGEQFVYSVPSSERKIEMNNLGIAYFTAYNALQETYGHHPTFQLFERVYHEHFKRRDDSDKIILELRLAEELTSDMLQSPDDLEATFRSKRKERHHGFVALGIETCHPDNQVNLVTTLAVDKNNVDDSVLLENKLDQLSEQCPDLNEIHLDAGFGSEENDTKAKKEKIKIIQSAVRGKTAKVKISVKGNEKKGFMIDCPNPKHPTIQASKSRKNYKAAFELTICNECPFKLACPAYRKKSEPKQTASFYFPATLALMQKRHNAIYTIPKKRRTIRAGVEGLMGQMHRGERHTGKLKVRGLFKCKLYVFSMGIAINFMRIYSWLFPKYGSFFAFFTFLVSPFLTDALSRKNC